MNEQLTHGTNETGMPQSAMQLAAHKRRRVSNLSKVSHLPSVITAAPVLRRQRVTLRLLVTIGLISLFIFLYWLSSREHVGYQPLYYLLLFSIGYKVLKVLFEWYHYWSIRQPAKPKKAMRAWTVDMLTTAMPGEPFELIADTLRAMVAVHYPHQTYLCDEGNDPKLKELCLSLGVQHVTRTVKVDAKAGNINNALRFASGEICVILDPDHRPVPQMLDEVLPYFEQEDIGYVQSVQAYQNANESFVARGAAEQTYTFYGPLMMGMSHYGTAQAIGANCVFRRAALDSISGHAAGLSEDMHTAMRLHAKGWKSVYVPKILTRGLVPSNISAYYKQQLKWSRGTFELLFRVLPSIFKNLTWRQRLHYSLLPLHFAAGIIALIDMVIPLAALITGEAPLLLEFSKAYIYLLPFFCMVILIRQYAQHWLLEKKERGFHLTGGLLLFGTWWVHLVGFVYTIFKVKVPYIPTPKESECRNHFTLSLPNLVAVFASMTVIGYGISLDSNPYNLLMAAYAGFNTLLLLITVWVGQDYWQLQIKNWFQPLAHSNLLQRYFIWPLQSMGNALFIFLSRKAPQLAVVFCCVFLLLAWNNANNTEPSEVAEEKDLGGFYLGLHLPQVAQKQSIVPFLSMQQATGLEANVVALTEYWDNAPSGQLPDRLLNDINAKGSMPLINWLPVNKVPVAGDSISAGKGIWRAINSGRFDSYILAYADKLRQYGHPVFINFAPEADNPAVPWYVHRFNPVRDYIDAFRKVQVLFLQSGVNNVSWIWNPWKAGNMEVLYPGSGFVDWVGVSSIEPEDSFGNKVDFEKTFAPFHRNMKNIAKPIMLSGFTLRDDPAYMQWLKDAVRSFNTKFPEIDGLVLQDRPDAKGDAFRFAAEGDAKNYAVLRSALSLLRSVAPVDEKLFPVTAGVQKPLRGAQLKGSAGNYTLLSDGKPFYIRGVAYNPEQSWRDGYHPLHRKKLDADFKAIKEMGANTIRRYAPSGYDRNILKAANNHGLKIMYGFWFDPKVDYARDKAKVAAYMRKVEKTVAQYKGEKAILAWNIGNESSGLLKHHFAQPYLTVVRRAYINMIEAMARKVHELDPERVVFTSLEHARQLPGELYAFTQYAPSVDVVAVNSYYKEWISTVHELSHRFREGKPYMISEFGPKGYWEKHLNDLDRRGLLDEESDKYKALLYDREWREDVLAHKGCNVGGIAFCWQDRFEGTATWFGLTDYKGRKKHAYYTLKEAWQGNPAPELTDLFINGPDFQLKPGGMYEFTVVSTDKNIKDFEWQLLSGDYLEAVGKIEKGGAPNRVRVTFPRKGNRFRLYVFAGAGKGRVITASRPVSFYEGIFNEGI